MSNIKFSLVVGTLGRYSELNEFLGSVCAQTFDLSKVEVIIVDQNDKIVIDPLITIYKNKIPNLTHIKIDKIGVSQSRNIGIQSAKGEILAFPDDDCLYFPDTLKRVFLIFQENQELDFLLGGVFSSDGLKKEIRSWPDKRKKITACNYFNLYSMITFFTKKRMSFDEEFGGGGKYFAYEDCDIVIRHLNENYTGEYNPNVKVSHPPLDVAVMDVDKISKYSYGFGALCAKHFSSYLLVLFLSSIFYHSLFLIYSLVTNDLSMLAKRWSSISSRISGWLNYAE